MARLKADIRDYASAKKFLGTPLDRPLGHNTRVSLTTAGLWEGSIAVWLHQTAIVRFYADGKVRLDSGGWQTVTTADRIRQTLPVGFYLEVDRGIWFIVDHRPDRFPEREARFVDGMLIYTKTEGNPFRG